MKNLFLLLPVILTLFAYPANAEEHRLSPRSMYGSGQPALPTIVFEYGMDDNGGVGVRIDLDVEALYFPLEGHFETTLGNMTDARDIVFHQVVSTETSPAFMSPARRFHAVYTIGYLQSAGEYTFEVKFENEGSYEEEPSETEARFRAYLPTFEPVEHICNLRKNYLAFDFTVWSLKDLPPEVTTISVSFLERVVDVHSVPFHWVEGGFGWVHIPLAKSLYRNLFEGQKLNLRWTIDGETVPKTFHFPLVENILPSCERG